MFAVLRGHESIVDELLDQNPALDFQDPQGFSALTHAVTKEHKDMVARLLKHGANPNVEISPGYTILTL